jgi:hypothetical protein
MDFCNYLAIKLEVSDYPQLIKAWK